MYRLALRNKQSIMKLMIVKNILKVIEKLEEVEILSIWSNHLAGIGKES